MKPSHGLYLLHHLAIAFLAEARDVLDEEAFHTATDTACGRLRKQTLIDIAGDIDPILRAIEELDGTP